MTQALILGGGMIGSAMAIDMARGPFRVTVADSRKDTLDRVAARCGVGTAQTDLGNPQAVTALASGYDVVLGALPSLLGFPTLRAVIEAGRPYVDISFMVENALELDELAREKGVTAVVDCGVAPGLSNMLAAYGTTLLDTTDNVDICCGGLPSERRWPFEYKAGFAPYDVIEEYTRPVRVVENGKVVIKEALSEPELLDFPGVGTLEAFNTDGLRSLLFTLKVPNMRERTLRYPGHIALMRVFRETGLFSKEAIDAGGRAVRPLDVTSALLFPQWTFADGEADLTVLRVAVLGHNKKGERERHTFDMIDRYDPSTGLRSMSRTTAFPATVVAGLLAEGRFAQPGVHAPEKLGGQAALMQAVLGGLKDRGVHCVARTDHG